MSGLTAPRLAEAADSGSALVTGPEMGLLSRSRLGSGERP